MGHSKISQKKPQHLAIVINGDSAPLSKEHHGRNESLAATELSQMRSSHYSVQVIGPAHASNSSQANEAVKAIRALAQDSSLSSEDQVVVYFTGHGDLQKDEPGIVMRDRVLYASEFVENLKKLPSEVTVVMDQCYSGNFASLFAESPNFRFIGLSEKGLTDICQPFAPRLWQHSLAADIDGNGQLNWWERFHYATTAQRVPPEYSLAVYFAGSDVQEDLFPKKTKTVGSTQQLQKELDDLEIGQHAVVLFSAPWCKFCQDYKPFFKEQADGHYKFIIVSAVDISPFAQFGLGEIIPQVRAYGKNFGKEGASLGMSPRNITDLLPPFIAEHDPETLAKHWLKKGTDDQMRAAVRILVQKKGLKGKAVTSFLKSIYEDETQPMPARMEAVATLGGMARRVKFITDRGYEQLMKDRREPISWLGRLFEGDTRQKMPDFRKNPDLDFKAPKIIATLLEDDSLPLMLRAAAAISHIQSLGSYSSGDAGVQQSLDVLADALLTEHKNMSDDMLSNLLYAFQMLLLFGPKENTSPIQNRAWQLILATFKEGNPANLLRALTKMDSVKINYGARHLVPLAFDETVDSGVRYLILQAKSIDWPKGKRAQAIEQFMRSPRVPDNFKAGIVSEIFKQRGEDRPLNPGELIRDGLDPKTMHSLALEVLTQGPSPLPEEKSALLQDIWDFDFASDEENDTLREALVETIANGNQREIHAADDIFADLELLHSL